jgi:hypothetical protein
MGEYSVTAERAAAVGHAAAPPTGPPTTEVAPAAAAAVAAVAYQREFAARTDQVREARRFLADLLADVMPNCPAGLERGCPATDNAILCLSELAANAAIHSRSARPGGHFTVRAEIGPAGRVRVEVSDEGGQWTWPEPDDHSHGRGFVILSSLASAWGYHGDPATGWTVWFEVNCAA